MKLKKKDEIEEERKKKRKKKRRPLLPVSFGFLLPLHKPCDSFDTCGAPHLHERDMPSTPFLLGFGEHTPPPFLFDVGSLSPHRTLFPCTTLRK
jgi:hypothetical protein